MMRLLVRIIFIVILIIAIVLGIFLFLNPAIMRNMELLNDIDSERQNYDNLNGLVDEYLMLRNDYNVLNAKYQKLSLELPFDNDTTLLASDIYNLVDYSEVDLESINFRELETEEEEGQTEQSTIGIIEIEMIISGTFFQSLTFVNSFEVLPRIMKIKEINIESNPEDFQDISTYIKAETYYDKNI